MISDTAMPNIDVKPPVQQDGMKENGGNQGPPQGGSGHGHGGGGGGGGGSGQFGGKRIKVSGLTAWLVKATSSARL